VCTAKSCKGGEFPSLQNGDLSVKEETFAEKHRSFSISGGWCSVGNPAQKNYLSREPKKEGQGPHKALEPIILIIMKMMMEIKITAVKRNIYIISNPYYVHVPAKYVI
jgi:hypothetical protein